MVMLWSSRKVTLSRAFARSPTARRALWTRLCAFCSSVRVPPRGLLVGDRERPGRATQPFVTEVEQDLVQVGGPFLEDRQRAGGLQRGRVVLAAGAYVGGPQRPAVVGGGQDLDVAAVVGDLAGPPQVDALGRAGDAQPVGLDDRAVDDQVAVAGEPGPHQRFAQVRGLPSTAMPSWR